MTIYRIICKPESVPTATGKKLYRVTGCYPTGYSAVHTLYGELYAFSDKPRPIGSLFNPTKALKTVLPQVALMRQLSKGN